MAAHKSDFCPCEHHALLHLGERAVELATSILFLSPLLSWSISLQEGGLEKALEGMAHPFLLPSGMPDKCSTTEPHPCPGALFLVQV